MDHWQFHNPEPGQFELDQQSLPLTQLSVDTQGGFEPKDPLKRLARLPIIIAIIFFSSMLGLLFIVAVFRAAQWFFHKFLSGSWIAS